MSGPSPSPIFPTEPKDNKLWRYIQCDDTFPRSKLPETHAVDTDHKAYRCTKEKACGKLFILRPSWIRHERSHSARKTHACSRCGKKFHRKDNCHDHERTCGRVARWARGSSQSASASTTTSSGTTESGTPVDLLTTILDDEERRHVTKTAFDTPDASRQKDNGLEDENAHQSASRRLSVPRKSPPASPAAYLSTMAMVPTQSRTAAIKAGTATHPPVAEHDTLLRTLDNTENLTTSRSIISQPHADSDWRQWFRSFQSPGAAQSPDLQPTAENWDFTPRVPAQWTKAMPASDVLQSLRYDHSAWPTHSAAGHARQHMSSPHSHDNNTSDRPFWPRLSVTDFGVVSALIHAGANPNRYDDTHSRPVRHLRSSARAFGLRRCGYRPHVHNNVAVHGGPVAVSNRISVPARHSTSRLDTSDSVLHISEPKPESKPHGKVVDLPEPTPRSKMAKFFSKLKAYIKAPVRRHKQ